MGHDALVIGEDIMVEHLPPMRLLVGGQVADRHHRVVQSLLRLAQPAGRVAPPVIDQDVEIRGSLDMVPPKGGDEDRIASLQLGHLPACQRLGEAGVAVEIGGVEIDHADRAARRRVVDRAEIEVAELTAWEEREAPLPDRADRQIMRDVIMCGNPRARADPDAGQQFALAQIDMVRLVQPVEIALHIDRGEIDGRRVRLARKFGNAGEDFGKPRLHHPEVHRHRIVVEQSPAAAWHAD